jgi:hypothetical protein
MVLPGGIGVLVVVAFVAAVALGRDTTVKPGDRVAVIAAREAPRGLAILVGRCEDERVRDVELRVPGGPPLWEIRSVKGGIDRSYVPGEDPPPFGFETTTALQPFPPGPLEAVVTVDASVDSQRFDPTHLDETSSVGAPCGSRDIGLVPLLFALGGAGVVLAYGAMVRRFLLTR